jgi:dethiobiotin synthetase
MHEMTETRRSNVVIVAGTDTGVGKTWVTAAIARALTEAGRRVIAVKPDETGCTDATREQEDGVLLARATGQSDPLEALHRFTAPVSAAEAGEREGGTPDFDEVLVRIESLAAEADLLLIEGASGVLSPITWEWNLVDLGQALDARALVVALDRRGTINHTLLTLSALEIGGIPLAAVVLNAPETPDPSTGSNAGAIARLAGFAHITVVPRVTGDAAAADALRETAESLIGVR